MTETKTETLWSPFSTRTLRRSDMTPYCTVTLICRKNLLFSDSVKCFNGESRARGTDLVRLRPAHNWWVINYYSITYFFPEKANVSLLSTFSSSLANRSFIIFTKLHAFWSLWPICFENLTQLYVLPGGLRHGETGATVEKFKSSIIFIAARKKFPKNKNPGQFQFFTNGQLTNDTNSTGEFDW